MTRSLRVLDAFSCKGGAGQGYLDAGCNVIGVDIKDYSNEYPGLFIQGDAVAFIRDYGRAFDLVHMSAPCQPYTRGNAMRRVNGVDPRWPTLIDAARNAAIESGVPYASRRTSASCRNCWASRTSAPSTSCLRRSRRPIRVGWSRLSRPLCDMSSSCCADSTYATPPARSVTPRSRTRRTQDRSPP